MKKLFPAFCLALAAPLLSASFRLNYAGYDAALPKSLVVESVHPLQGSSWRIVQEGSSVPLLSGKFSAGTRPDDWTSGTSSYYRLDFSEIAAPGSYVLRFEENGTTVEQAFSVSDRALEEYSLAPVLRYFRMDRNTNADVSVPVYGSSARRDVHGGWNDASGDVSKYLSHLSYANYLNPQQIPLTVWALSFAAERIPEAITKTTGDENYASDEALYGADFLLRMLDGEGFFYMTVFDNWGSGSRTLCAFSGSDGVKSEAYKTAFREGGGMAIAALARVSALKRDGDFSSSEYLAGAKRGLEHLLGVQTIGGSCLYCDDGKENIIDDYTALLALSEVFAATGESEYLLKARERALHLSERLSESGYFFSDAARTRPFWHASDAGLPLISLVRYLEIETDGNASKQILFAAKKHLSWILSVTDVPENSFGYARQTYRTGDSIRTGFFIPHDNESKYWWQGENARIASLSAAVSYAARALSFSDSSKAFVFSADQLDWILGKNPYGVSFMEGVGKNNPPAYAGQAGEGMLVGGIANGITGKNVDGSGIVWNNVAEAGFFESWQNWRWIEQWLPHSTWFLMALSARYDESPVSFPSSVVPSKAVKTFSLALSDGMLRISSDRPIGSLEILDLNGKIVRKERILSNTAALPLFREKPGIYLVKVSGATVRKIVLRDGFRSR